MRVISGAAAYNPWVRPSPGIINPIDSEIFSDTLFSNCNLISSAKTLKDSKQNAKIGKKNFFISSFFHPIISNIFSTYGIDRIL